MHETEMKLKPICEMKEKLVSWTKEEMEKGKECIDTKEMGDVVDMIKDLAKAEKDCWEACYYKSVVKAMEQYEEDDDEEGPMGYNTHHSARTGRFVSGRSGYGRGRHMRMGFQPTVGQMPYIQDYLEDGRMDERHMMGYTGGQTSQTGGMGSNRSGYDSGMSYPRHGQAYNEYQAARRHYTQTNSMADKKEMEAHAHEHVADTIATMRDIWDNADPELKRQMKKDFEKLMEDMKV